ncbi:MAG: DUF58 domain-containing protein [Gammaproteobacteria bacterium]|nr:DUF58 domain-containing protein [Gammaproteobacteria bacterium]
MKLWNKKHTPPAQPAASRATHIDLQGLIQLRFQSAHLSLGSQRKAYSSLAGNYSSPFKGRGVNFDEVRPYQPGDDFRIIDWNVTARTDKVHTKVFKEERERPVFIIVDLSSSMYFGTRHCLKSVTAAKAAALIAWAGADNHNRIGGLVFNDSTHMEMRPKGGHQGVLRFLKLMTDFHNKNSHNQHSTDGKQQDKSNSFSAIQSDELNSNRLNTELLFARIQKVIQTGSIVLLASDFKNTNEEITKHIRHIARHNDLLMTHIYDPLETELPPPGQYGISNGEQYQLLDTRNTSLRKSFQALFQNKVEEMEQFCLHNQIHLISLATNDNVADKFLATLGKDSSVRRIARSRH